MRSMSLAERVSRYCMAFLTLFTLCYILLHDFSYSYRYFRSRTSLLYLNFCDKDSFSARNYSNSEESCLFKKRNYSQRYFYPSHLSYSYRNLYFNCKFSACMPSRAFVSWEHSFVACVRLACAYFSIFFSLNRKRNTFDFRIEVP